ncbi:succinate-semialdehyde dehydrogenase [Pedobacter yulinensis]|uniref:Succinate-semialdehyde dehydrogenase n=1 Tax=Pedobacter yulinensis TaxID=2126353 RepID=A0A2T3HMF5_9SPHI|nr:NAD-dependent succinate-semialdehyde dehydrogenase [Pedobacter yulinensis]PST83617.1 succinate-semialdehyde dehydrogenase [Pedobacter yulinensis]
MIFHSINPATGRQVKRYTAHSTAQTGKRITRAQQCWLQWRETALADRAQLLVKLALVLEQRKEEMAILMAVEMGKPLKDGRAEIDKCASVCRYYAEHGTSFLADQAVATAAASSYVSFQPIGLVLAIMPWNFPFWQVFRFLAPALMAGNCGLLKHASNVPGCALAIESLVAEAGFPAGVFQTLLLGSGAMNDVIAHPLVKAVTLTGSTEAGRKVAEKAGSLLKKTVLELGGSDPYLVLADADLGEAAAACASSRLINNGQSCIAAKRFIVAASVEKDFTALFCAEMSRRTTGDPFDPETDLGPMARADLRNELHEQVLQNIRAGARCLTGGTVPQKQGNHAFYQPTVLSGVKKGMPAFSEEIFGPVASIIRARDTRHAVELANGSIFGLGAAVFTRNAALAESLARNQLQAGSCFVNDLVRSDPRLPFGGINQSGYGRELGEFGIHEFVNIKTVYIS